MATVNIYVDGFNLYYRCLKDTPHKWLDLSLLCRALLPQGSTINRIRYFTARVQALPDTPNAPVEQQVYLRALSTIPEVSIVFGHFLTKEVFMRLAQPAPGGPRFVKVLRTDEKGSDVNLASYLLLDAFKGDSEMAFVISNDSDLAEPIRIVRREFGMKVGVALPENGQASRVLIGCSDFVKKIRDGALKSSQFPSTMTDPHGTFTKPAGWD